MMMKILQINTIFLAALFFGCTAQKKTTGPQNDLLQTIERNFGDASAQYKVMMTKLAPTRFPKTYHAQKDSMETSNSEWWCSGFYPGTLLYLYQQTKDQSLLNETERILKVLEKEKNNKTTHDLGFMMFCSFGNANYIAA